MIVSCYYSILQVIRNLLSNSLKFTPAKGKVTLKATFVPDFIQDAQDIADLSPLVLSTYKEMSLLKSEKSLVASVLFRIKDVNNYIFKRKKEAVFSSIKSSITERRITMRPLRKKSDRRSSSHGSVSINKILPLYEGDVESQRNGATPPLGSDDSHRNRHIDNNNNNHNDNDSCMNETKNNDDKYKSNTNTNTNNPNIVKGKLVVVVKDSGAGISPINQKKLFKEIIQFQPQTLQAGGGSGLGVC